MPYAKLDAGIIFSTVWREPHSTVRVWIALLAMKNMQGEVQSSIPGLADAARVTIPECEAALVTLRAPDKYSRTKDHEGRRIEDILGGWFVINHKKFRDLDNGDDRKRKAADRAKRYRDRHAVTRDERDGALRDVTVTPSSRQLSQADADADAENRSLVGKDQFPENNTTTRAKKSKPSEAQKALRAIRRLVKVPEAFNAMLRTINEPTTGGKGFSWPVIGAALVEFRSSNSDRAPTAAAMRAYCRRLENDPAVADAKDAGQRFLESLNAT